MSEISFLTGRRALCTFYDEWVIDSTLKDYLKYDIGGTKYVYQSKSFEPAKSLLDEVLKDIKFIYQFRMLEAGYEPISRLSCMTTHFVDIREGLCYMAPRRNVPTTMSRLIDQLSAEDFDIRPWPKANPYIVSLQSALYAMMGIDLASGPDCTATGYIRHKEPYVFDGSEVIATTANPDRFSCLSNLDLHDFQENLLTVRRSLNDVLGVHSPADLPCSNLISCDKGSEDNGYLISVRP